MYNLALFIYLLLLILLLLLQHVIAS